MIASLFKKSPIHAIPHQIYGGLMAQARDPAFFAQFGVPDSVMGRFDMLAMHVYLFSRRLRQDKAKNANSLSQDVFDLFVADLDRALRELGVGDTTVPKRKKKLVHSFYAQIEEFDPHLEVSDADGLAIMVNARYLSDAENGDAQALADYMVKTAHHLDSISLDNFMKGQVTWLQV